MGNMTIKGNKALEYCRKYPDTATKTLARKLYRETESLFESVEQARYHVRRYRGQAGTVERRTTACQDCFTESGDSRRNGRPGGVAPAGVKVLLFDIETSPNIGYVWRCYKENIAPSQLITESKVICWAAKWLGSDEVMFDSIQNDVDGDGSLQAWIDQDDSRVCATIYERFNEADVVVAHCGKAFDCAHLNTRWAALGFAPPQPYKVFDTLLAARKTFNFPTNKLEGIAKYFGLPQKLSHEGFGLWVKCMAGDPDAWEHMEKYNIQDVLVLEKVYLKIRAWSKMHPNLATIAGGNVPRCTCCGSTAQHEVAVDTHTNLSKFPTYRCDECGAVMRGCKRYKPEADIENRRAVTC